jgi:hypothetical protein
MTPEEKTAGHNSNSPVENGTLEARSACLASSCFVSRSLGARIAVRTVARRLTMGNLLDSPCAAMDPVEPPLEMNRMTRLLFEEIDLYTGRGKAKGSVTKDDICLWLGEHGNLADYKQEVIDTVCHDVRLGMRCNADGRVQVLEYQDYFDQKWLAGIYDLSYDKEQDEMMFKPWLEVQARRRKQMNRL